jgi:hypothetical protein
MARPDLATNRGAAMRLTNRTAKADRAAEIETQRDDFELDAMVGAVGEAKS